MKLPLSQVRPVVLAIGGSDSAGMAGLAMDNRCIHALGGHVCNVLTAVTAQNNQKLLAINPVSDEVFSSQLEALASISVAAVKIGLIASHDQLDNLLVFLGRNKAPVIYDPVLASSSGHGLVAATLLTRIRNELIPCCDLLTPNFDEAQALTEISVQAFGLDENDVAMAVDSLLGLGAKAVLIKGGHGGSNFSQDFFCSSVQQFHLNSERVKTSNSRGTGCALASCSATALARGFSLEDAVVIAKTAINQGFRQAYALADGNKGPILIDHFPKLAGDLPRLRTVGTDLPELSFARCGDTDLGLYPVVDRADWLQRLLPLGISTIQLRIKDLGGEALRRELALGIAIAKQYDCRLFINDYWQMAIELGAYGVHLGQEDLAGADMNAIAEAGLRLGLSSHCYYEVARAYTLKPSYIACGPVYHTDSKVMPWVPQGLEGLTRWLEMINDIPWVAIGGINHQRLAAVAATGVSGIAMISAITHASNPAQSCVDLMAVIAAQKACV